MARQKSRAAVLFAAVVAAVFCTIAFHQFSDFFSDDAYISLRYARNLVHGHGLVWNPGEHVEGYTSFAHVLLLSLLGLLGFDYAIAARAIGVAAFIGLALYLYHAGARLVQRESHHPLVVAAALSLGLCSTPLVIWSLGGLETTLYALLCTVALWSYAAQMRDPAPRAGWYGAGLALLGLVRPDGMMFIVIAGAFALAQRIAGQVRDNRHLWSLIAGAAAVWVPFFAWRLLYYGDLLPNTYYAKSGFSVFGALGGFAYAFEYAVMPPWLPALTLMALLLVTLRGRVDVRMAFLTVCLCAYGMYVGIVGGDHMPGYRFLVPMIPVSALLLNLACQKLVRHGARGLAHSACYIAPVLILLQFVFYTDMIRRARLMDPAAYFGTVIGQYVANHWEPGALVATNAAGAFPFHAADQRFIDMLGLNDRHIARRDVDERVLPWQYVPGHLKGDGEYVLERAPKYIILGPSCGVEPSRPRFLSDLELARAPEFKEQYQMREVTIDVSHLPRHTEYLWLEDGVMEFVYFERVGEPAFARGTETDQ